MDKNKLYQATKTMHKEIKTYEEWELYAIDFYNSLTGDSFWIDDRQFTWGKKEKVNNLMPKDWFERLTRTFGLKEYKK